MALPLGLRDLQEEPPGRGALLEGASTQVSSRRSMPLAGVFQVEAPTAAEALDAATEGCQAAGLQLLDRVLVAIDDGRRLGQALALQEAQHDHLALLGRQAGQTGLDLVKRDLLVDAAEDGPGRKLTNPGRRHVARLA